MGEMPATLSHVLGALHAHEIDLRRRGVCHAAVFGSVARGEARADSDIDVLVELDPQLPIGLFEYARLKLYIAELLGDSADVVNRKTLKPLLRDAILRDAVNAF
jgi:predicted nucleotidyltransferase